MTDRPWMTAVEMQFAAMSHSVLRDKPIAREPLRRATAYSWAPEIYRVVEAACNDVPDSTRLSSDDLPEAACWWWFGPTSHVVAWGARENTPVVALLLFREAGSVAFATFSAPSFEQFKPIVSTHWMWLHSETLDEMLSRLTQERVDQLLATPAPDEETRDFGDQALLHAVHLSRFVVEGLRWMSDRLTVSPGHIERHRRKQLAREGRTDPPPDVKIIELRARETAPRDPNAPAGHIEFAFRFPVRKHPRRLKSGKVITVKSYVKGPKDKPLRVPTHTVYAVTR